MAPAGAADDDDDDGGGAGEEDERARARAPVRGRGERGERGERLAFYDFDFTTTPSLSEDVLGTT